MDQSNKRSVIHKFLNKEKPFEDLKSAGKDAFLQADTYDKVFSRRRQSLDKEIPAFSADAIINSAVSLIMETAFQVNDNQSLFRTTSKYSAIVEELDKYHEQIDADTFCLTTALNLLFYGNLPIRLKYNSNDELERFAFEPDYTAVTPLIVSNNVIGYMKDGKFYEPFEYIYSQLIYYKDLGGTRSRALNNKLFEGTSADVVNEFTLAPSYLSGAYKPYKAIKIIEDALLMQRLDQSNFMRFIMVGVGESVLAKNASQVYNFYKSLLKKARRVSFDSDGLMSSSGSNNEFEVILPKSSRQDVDVKEIGGQLEVRAIKDLDMQYKRLFASLRVQPSQIGFSEEPGGSLGDSPVTVWEKRLARTVKTLVASTSRTLKTMDYYYLRSRGFDVRRNDWMFQFTSVSTLEEEEKRKSLEAGIKSYTALQETLNKAEISYSKDYLLKTMLSDLLSNSNIDVNELFSVEQKSMIKSDISLIKTDRAKYLKSFVMLGVATETELGVNKDEAAKKFIGSSRLVSYEDFEAAPDVYAHQERTVKIPAEVADITSKKFRESKRKNLPNLSSLQLYSNVGELSAQKLLTGRVAPLNKLTLLKNGFYLDDLDLVNYLYMLDTGVKEVPVTTVMEEV